MPPARRPSKDCTCFEHRWLVPSLRPRPTDSRCETFFILLNQTAESSRDRCSDKAHCLASRLVATARFLHEEA